MRKIKVFFHAEVWHSAWKKTLILRKFYDYQWCFVIPFCSWCSVDFSTFIRVLCLKTWQTKRILWSHVELKGFFSSKAVACNCTYFGACKGNPFLTKLNLVVTSGSNHGGGGICHRWRSIWMPSEKSDNLNSPLGCLWFFLPVLVLS